MQDLWDMQLIDSANIMRFESNKLCKHHDVISRNPVENSNSQAKLLVGIKYAA